MSTQLLSTLYSETSAQSLLLSRLLHLCFQTRNLKATKSLHAHLLKSGLLFTSLNLHTNLSLSYATDHHHNNFQFFTDFFHSLDPTNPLPFNAIVSSFSRHGFPSLALRTTSFMQVNNVPLDTYTLCSSLIASSSIKAVNFGKQLHAHVAKSGLSSSVYVGSSLIDFYAKLLAIDDAWNMFDEIPVKNTVCANALLSGLAETRMWDEGLSLVRTMRILELDYDQFTLSAILRVCAGLSAVELGRQVHGNLIRTSSDMETDVFLQSSLIEMYGKCGLVEKARYVFDLVGGIGEVGGRKRDVVCWTSMLCAYGRNGRFEDVIGLYELMVMNGVRPDKVVFVAVISACGHTGNVNLGLKHFNSMTHDFGLNPDKEHYSCVVDLLCRGGELEKAWKFVNEIPIEVGSSSSSSSSRSNDNTSNIGSISLWGALLSACLDYGNVEMGKLAAERALELDPDNVGIYVLLSNLYASVGMWNEIEELRELMKERGLKKDVGCSWIEVTS